MGRCAIQLVIGPAGSGKTTYCRLLAEHAAVATHHLQGRPVYVANLDPAAEEEILPYQPAFDIRELISVPEVMEELGLGPNGGLLYCMEYLLEHADTWLRDHLDEYDDDDYLLLDCPGQVELYSHIPVLRLLVDRMRQWGYEASLVAVFCLDATFLLDASKFISGCLLSLTAMMALELPHVTVLTKCDLVEPLNPDGEEPEDDDDDDEGQESWVERLLASMSSASEAWHRQQDRDSLLISSPPTRPTDDWSRPPSRTERGPSSWSSSTSESSTSDAMRLPQLEARRRHRQRLTDALGQLLDDFHYVSMVPLNPQKVRSIDHVMATVNHAGHYGEDLEVRAADGPEPADPPNDFFHEQHHHDHDDDHHSDQDFDFNHNSQ